MSSLPGVLLNPSTCRKHDPSFNEVPGDSSYKILENQTHAVLTQFILDPTSLNLPNAIRIQPGVNNLNEVLRCSNKCFLIQKEQIKQLDKLGLVKKKIIF